MKKTLIFLTAALMLTLSACGGNGKVTDNGTDSDMMSNAASDIDSVVDEGKDMLDGNNDSNTDTDMHTDSDGIVGTFSTELFE